MKNSLILFLAFVLVFGANIYPVQAQESTEYPVYIIQDGDSLIQIAKRFNVSVEDLTSLNSISDQDFISPGQPLKIPGLIGITGTIIPKTIELGENARSLLNKYQVSQQTLVQLNKITNFSELYAGSNLLVPIENETALSPVAIMDNNSTFLEEAVSAMKNPAELTLQNGVRSVADLFPNDLIYGRLDANSVEPVNPFSSAVETIIIEPLPLTQGATAVIQVLGGQGLTFSGQLNGHELRFFSPDGSSYFALQGIHAMAETGLADFSITATNAEGAGFSYSQSLLLNPEIFESDPPLTVDPSLIDPTVTQPEEDLIRSVTSVFTPDKYWSGTFQSPAFYPDITSPFGSRRSYNENPLTFHTGVDFGGGITLPITAPADGKVVIAEMLTVRGNATFIDHGLGIYSGFFHQNKIFVKVGDLVKQGDIIGEVGNTGRVNGRDDYEGAGAHQHWEVWVNGVQVNPLDWLYREYP